MTATAAADTAYLDSGLIPAAHRPSLAGRLGRFVRWQPLNALAVLLVFVLAVAALFAPILATHDPLAIDPLGKLQDPSAEHWLGTDGLGRDVFSRILYGARVSLVVGLGATVAGTILGTLIGLVSGYVGGLVDHGIQRVTDGIQAIPPVVFLLLVAAIWRQGMLSMLVIITALMAPYTGRVIRGAVLAEREAQYVLAARALGATPRRIMLRHILPNVFAPVIVLASFAVGDAILTEGALSYLGFGIKPDDPTWITSWGGMLRPDDLQYMLDAPWLSIFPGLAITITVLAFNISGDALRDALDPKLRGSRG